MNSSMNIVIGTVGMGAWYSRDFGETWVRPFDGIYSEARIWALSAHPNRPGEFLAGTDRGIMRWNSHPGPDGCWTHMSSQLDDSCVWSLARSPTDPDCLLAGTQFPAAVFRSTDGGENWEQLGLKLPQNCRAVIHPRVTRVIFDPHDEQTFWAGVEIDGVRRSSDGGKTWKKMSNGFVSDDVHDLIALRHQPGTLLATTNKGLHRTDDHGATWRLISIDSPYPYTRAIVEVPNAPGTLFLTNGNGPPGSWGRLFRSEDGGGTWTEVTVPFPTNSTFWCVAVHPSDSDLIFLCTNLGQIYRSADRGKSWSKAARELGEIRTACWVLA